MFRPAHLLVHLHQLHDGLLHLCIRASWVKGTISVATLVSGYLLAELFLEVCTFLGDSQRLTVTEGVALLRLPRTSAGGCIWPKYIIIIGEG